MLMLHQVVLSVPELIENRINVAGSDSRDILTCPGIVLLVVLSRIVVMKSDMSSPFLSVLDMYISSAESWVALFSLTSPDPGSPDAVLESKS